MAFVITDPESIRLANEIAAITGETAEEAVLNAVRGAYQSFLEKRSANPAIDLQHPS
jgi:hypothetical protein